MKFKNNSYFYLYIAAAGILLIASVGILYGVAKVSKAQTTQYIYIDGDDTQDSVVAKMTPFCHTAGMTGLQTLMRHTSYANHIRTGRYAIEPEDGALTIFRRLKNGQQSPIRLTIPEARTITKLAAFLGQKLMIDSSTIVHALTSEEQCYRLGYDTCTIIAMFVPNTYEVYWDISVDNFLKRIQREHDNFWKGDREQKATQINLSPNEVATLASIIDEETANNAEKPMIAGMYLNRLSHQMPLQADPTIKFALKQFELKRIYQKLLLIDSPYNTYRNTGLPPGPIKIASIKGIDAVLNHIEHQYIYMCAKEDFSGTHNFAVTYREHLQNAARYSKALNERGIK